MIRLIDSPMKAAEMGRNPNLPLRKDWEGLWILEGQCEGCSKGKRHSASDQTYSWTGFSEKGYNPQPGERTFDGYVRNNANPEISLYTDSARFNNNGNIGGQFKRLGAESGHGINGPHVHQPLRNVAPGGSVFGDVGSKTKNGGVTSPMAKDIKQLYEYIKNGKYHR